MVRKKADTGVKKKERKQMVGGGEEKRKFVSTSTEMGIEKSELRNNTNLNGGIVKLGSSTFRPAQRTIVGVGEKCCVDEKEGKARPTLQIAVPSTRRSSDGTM